MLSAIPSPKVHEATGIEQSVFEMIVAAIERSLELFPTEPIDLHEIALSTCTDIPSVKKVCYFLLAIQKVKASFFPAHKWCGIRLGDTAISVYSVEQSIDDGVFDGTCQFCGGIIRGKDSVDVAMDFWKPGKKIK